MRRETRIPMQALLKLFTDIVLHRRGPQDVPASPAVLWIALLAYVGLGSASLAIGAEDPGEVLGQIAVDLALVVGGFGILLVLAGKGHRLRQTLAALFGTGALLSAASLPFLWMAGPAPGAGEEVTQGILLASLALVILLFASLMVTGHILRSALDWPYAGGVLAAVVYFAASIAVLRWLFPGNAG